MAVWIAFQITCAGCGYTNKPHQSPRKGIRMVLEGLAGHCKECGALFAKIRIPKRPLVSKVVADFLREGSGLSAPYRLEFFSYEGAVPRAVGYPLQVPTENAPHERRVLAWRTSS